MMRKTFLFFCLLLPLIMQGCAPSAYRPPTPYQRQPPIEQGEAETVHGTPEPATRPKTLLINDISQQADLQIQNGQLTAAAQTLERGLRIAPKNGLLWSQLALVRLQQHHYGQAQSLAAKSNTLAGGDGTLIRRNQRIIEEAQRGGQ